MQILFEVGKAAIGQVKSINIVQAEDRSSLMRAMDISIAMQHKGGAVSGASAEYDLASSVRRLTSEPSDMVSWQDIPTINWI